MFGFVKAYKPELRIKEYEMYKAVYCSICKQIGKEYGFVSRFTLSYDFTFLMLLYLSLREDCLTSQKGKCIYNPLKTCNFIKQELPKMPLAAAEIMLYFKLKDNIEDEGVLRSFGAKILKTLSQKGYKKAANEFPELNDIFEEYYAYQLSVEQKNVSDLDQAAEPTAIMLSKLFLLCFPSGENRALERLGYCLGRWIYILDVAADLEEDIIKGKFNPLKNEAEKSENFREFIINRLERTLNFCISEAAAAFELIDIKRFKNILGNIIYLGLENSQNEILKKEKCKK